METYSADIDNSWFAVDNKELEKLKTFRHAVSSKVSEFVAKRGLRKVGTDTSVPVENFRKYYHEMKKSVKKKSRICLLWTYRRLPLAFEYVASKRR